MQINSKPAKRKSRISYLNFLVSKVYAFVVHKAVRLVSRLKLKLEMWKCFNVDKTSQNMKKAEARVGKIKHKKVFFSV